MIIADRSYTRDDPLAVPWVGPHGEGFPGARLAVRKHGPVVAGEEALNDGMDGRVHG